ncbi:MAG TPA: sigma-70 family RNA polymerase sigma factor [Gemmataceae bacterium]|nr:sigma-70 family RNA polymerase sigma factor [Gemmataceae bacterium]
MVDQQFGAVLRHLHRLTTKHGGGTLSDERLLGRFVSDRDEAAFATLVQRHGPLVLRVCRRVLGHFQDAEDAFQATFLVLARKADTLRNRRTLAGWLYGVAHRTALTSRRSAMRRRRLDSPSGPLPPESPPAAAALRELQVILDDEVQRLPEKYRTPFVLCCLEGRSREDAARELGWKEGTVSSRIASARERLQRRLSRRGIALSSVVCADALAERVGGVPATLARAATRAALGTSARNASGPISEKVQVLAASVLKGMAMTKAKTLLAVLLFAGLIVAGAQVISYPGHAVAEPLAGDSPIAAAPAEPIKPDTARSLRVVVLDPDGKPIRDANIHAGIWTHEKGFKANRDYQTDTAGAVQVELPKTFHILRLWASKSPFVSMFANWEQSELATIKEFPVEYTFRLESGIASGGRILDEQGKPIAGVRVQLRMENAPAPARSDGRAHYDGWLATGSDATTTDAGGRWRLENVPNHPQIQLQLLVSHPDYVSDERWGEIQTAAGITTAMLKKGTATLTLKRGVIVSGSVTDPVGKPVPDAVVVIGDDPSMATTPSKFQTHADGKFRLRALAPHATTLTVIAPGWAPQLRKVELKAGPPPQDFHMAPGKPLRLRIVDATGRPVPNAYVSIMEWKGSESLHNVRETRAPQRADSDGVWTWTSAPDDPVKLRVYSKGFAERELEIAGGASERTVSLKPEHRVSGRVTDAVTGKPIPVFTVIPVDVYRKDFLSAVRGHAVAGKDGRLTILADRIDLPLRLRVEALGYRTKNGPEFRVGDNGARLQNFELQPSCPISGSVLDAAGEAVLNAEVLLATPTDQASLESSSSNHKTVTDAAGRFVFPDPGEPFALLGRAQSGFAFAEFLDGRHDAGTLRLRPWASLRGQFRDGGRPVIGATVLLQPIRIDYLDHPRIDGMMQSVTDADGRFQFARVPAVPLSVRVYLGPWKDEGYRSGPSVPLDLQPGQQGELDLGSGGTTVTGKVVLTGKVPTSLDCTYSLNYLVRREPGIAPPPAIASLGFDARNGWREAWRKSIEGQCYLTTLRHWFVKLAADGTFRISGVPAGDYDLAVAVYAKPSGCLVDPLARRVVRVTVTEADIARGNLTLPEIATQVAPIPAVGDTPTLAFERADGTAGSLTNRHGQYTVVHFWASWCGPCKQQLPALRALHERYAARGLAALGLALDESPAAWQAALKRLDLPWQQGRLAADSAAGVSSVPAYWLLDPAGKIVGKAADVDELAVLLADRLK